MAAVKTMREKMADEGLESFIVSYLPEGHASYMAPLTQQFWADDAAHAGEQMDDAEPFCSVLLVETQAEYEARTGETLDYGRGRNY